MVVTVAWDTKWYHDKMQFDFILVDDEISVKDRNAWTLRSLGPCNGLRSFEVSTSRWSSVQCRSLMHTSLVFMKLRKLCHSDAKSWGPPSKAYIGSSCEILQDHIVVQISDSKGSANECNGQPESNPRNLPEGGLVGPLWGYVGISERDIEGCHIGVDIGISC